MNLALNKEEAYDLKYVIISEIDYLTNTAIPQASGKDKEELERSLKRMQNILMKIDL